MIATRFGCGSAFSRAAADRDAGVPIGESHVISGASSGRRAWEWAEVGSRKPLAAVVRRRATFFSFGRPWRMGGPRWPTDARLAAEGPYVGGPWLASARAPRAPRHSET